MMTGSMKGTVTLSSGASTFDADFLLWDNNPHPTTNLPMMRFFGTDPNTTLSVGAGFANPATPSGTYKIGGPELLGVDVTSGAGRGTIRGGQHFSLVEGSVTLKRDDARRNISGTIKGHTADKACSVEVSFDLSKP